MPKNISPATKKVGMPKAPRFHRRSGLVGEALLRLGPLRGLEQGVRVEPRGFDAAGENFRVVELKPLLPHAAQTHFEIGGAFAERLRRDEPAHQHQRIDREMRVETELLQSVLGDEAADSSIS